MRQGFFAFAASLAVFAPMGFAAAAAEPIEEVLDEVVVTGEHPGPAMWKVSKGNHTLWIMGTLSPLPAKMTWKAQQAEQVIKVSGEILANSVSSLALGGDVGMLESIGLLRAVLRLRHNADGSTLRDVLPPDVYQRWHDAHRRWFGKDADRKERARPIYAAELLYEQALEKSGLSNKPLVWSTAERIARQHKVKVRRREFPMNLEDPRSFIADLADLPRDKEVACLVATMDYIDRELPDMKRRATAWARGDLEALRALPRENPRQSCREAVLQKPRFQELAAQSAAQFSADWSGIVDWMLLTHETSFTTQPIARLLEQQGVLAQLRARGYTVEEPQ